ncbi:MAG: hypothetical protein ACLSHU_04240 [Oscillospiraceae bacterium]
MAITSLGYEEFWDEEDEVMLDTEHFILLDNGGNLWHFWTYATDDGYSAWLSMFASDLALEFPGDDSGNNMYTSAWLPVTTARCTCRHLPERPMSLPPGTGRSQRNLQCHSPGRCGRQRVARSSVSGEGQRQQ